MNAKIYLSLFRRSDKLLLLGFFVFFPFAAVMITQPHHQEEMDANFLVLALSPAFILGSALIEIWYRPVWLPATVLLPGLQRVLRRWHLRPILIAAFVWGSFLAWLDHRIPWLAALGLSAGCFTAPIYFTRGLPDRRKSLPRESLIFWGIIISFNLPSIVTEGAARPLLAHIWISGPAGWILFALNLRFAWRHRPPATSVQPLLAPKPRTGVGHFLVLLRRWISGQKAPDTSHPRWNYASRKDSLPRRIQAAFQENPTGLRINVVCSCLIVLLLPWVAQPVGGYPLAWYRVIFDPGHINSLGARLTLMIALLASSLLTGLLHTSRLYPISRQQRLIVAFTASAVGFCYNFLAIAGGAILAGWLVGRWAELPVPMEPVTVFLTKMAMVVPFMSLMRWGELQLELRQNRVELFLFVAVVAIFVILGQSIVLAWGLRAGIAIALGSILISQMAYYAALRRFYYFSDFIQRGSGSSASELA